MQFTFIYLYLVMYFFLILMFLIFFLFFIPIFALSKPSIRLLFSLVQTYTKFPYLFYSIFLVFSGLPPVSIFFLKVNMLVLCLNYLNFLYFLIIFLILFFNIIFYLNIFRFTQSYNNNFFLTQSILAKSKFSSYKTININSLLKKPHKSYYSFIYYFLALLFYLYFYLFFSVDMLLLFKNFFL